MKNKLRWQLPFDGCEQVPPKSACSPSEGDYVQALDKENPLPFSWSCQQVARGGLRPALGLMRGG